MIKTKYLLLVSLVFAISACGKNDVQNESEFTEPKAIEEASNNGDYLSSAESLSKSENVPDRIGFSFDSSSISASQKRVLDEQITYIKAQQSNIKKISIGGYCDERGSIDYNLALGGKRAEAVKKYFVANGLKSSMIETISYGKNIVLVEGHTEEVYEQNRVAKIRLCSTSSC